MENKKRGGCLKTFLIIIGVFIVISILSNVLGGDNSKEPSNDTPIEDSNQTEDTDTKDKKETPEETTVKETNKKEPYEETLSAGHYQSGVDIPSGTYLIEAISGSGNVSSTNMFSGGLNETMSTTADEMYITEFKNARLEKNVVLSVSGDLEIKITTDEADTSGISQRENKLTEDVTLTSGNYVAGTDFEAGTYDVVYVEGNGNVSSSNMFEGGLNEVMGSGDDMYIQEFKNATFKEDTTLDVSGVTIKLVPSK